MAYTALHLEAQGKAIGVGRIVQGIHYGIDYNNNNNTSQTSTTPIKIFAILVIMILWSVDLILQ